MDPRTGFLFEITTSCGTWIGGLVLIVVGLVAVRRAHPGAAYMLAAAFAVDMLAACCSLVPSAYMQADGNFERYESLASLTSAVSLIAVLVTFGLVLGAAITLANSAKRAAATPSAPAAPAPGSPS